MILGTVSASDRIAPVHGLHPSERSVCVEFAGRKSGDELVSYFQLCDIYVHTPKVVDLKFEGFGIVYLEASACGKPIVATDAGGVRDAVIDGETGLIAGLLAKVRASLDLQMMEPTFERIFGGKNAMRLTSASAVTSAVEKVRVRLELD